MEGAVDKLALGGGDLQVAGNGPVFQRIGIFSHHPFAGAGGVQQDRIESFRQGGAKHAAIEMGERHVADPAAADIRVQHLNAAGGELVGEDRALVVHPRGDLGGFGAGGGRHVHHPGGHIAIGKQRSNRQHGARFLNIKEPAQMFCGTAQRQRLFVVTLDPESLFAPRHRGELPAVGGDKRKEIGHADFQGVDAQAAAQRALAGSDKRIKRERVRQSLAHLCQKFFWQIDGTLRHERTTGSQRGAQCTTNAPVG